MTFRYGDMIRGDDEIDTDPVFFVTFLKHCDEHKEPCIIAYDMELIEADGTVVEGTNTVECYVATGWTKT